MSPRPPEVPAAWAQVPLLLICSRMWKVGVRGALWQPRRKPREHPVSRLQGLAPGMRAPGLPRPASCGPFCGGGCPVSEAQLAGCPWDIVVWHTVACGACTSFQSEAVLASQTEGHRAPCWLPAVRRGRAWVARPGQHHPACLVTQWASPCESCGLCTRRSLLSSALPCLRGGPQLRSGLPRVGQHPPSCPRPASGGLSVGTASPPLIPSLGQSVCVRVESSCPPSWTLLRAALSALLFGT